MEGTLQTMVQICTELEEYFATKTADEIFGAGMPQVPEIVDAVRKLGVQAATLPGEEDGCSIVGKLPYLQRLGTVLQQADANIAFMFCKYDMGEFVRICNGLLADKK